MSAATSPATSPATGPGKGEPRVCVVGAGSLSTRRIYPYVGAAGGRLVGVCDLDRAKAERNARLWGGVPYDDMDMMLDLERPDGCIICIGPAAHAKLAPLVMRKGIAVYTEKPPSVTSAEALEVARVSRETGVPCTTAFKKRYAACYVRAKEFVDSFPPEDRYSISIDYASAQFRNDEPRRTFLLDFAIHAIDLVGYLFGDAARAFAFSKGKDAYAVSLEFRAGAVGSMNLTCGRAYDVPTEEVEITVRGGNFMTISNSSRWRITRDGKPSEWREPATFVSSGDGGYDTGHLAELEDWVASIGSIGSTGEKRRTRSDIFESYRSMVLYEAIARSAETGEVVAVECAPGFR